MTSSLYRDTVGSTAWDSLPHVLHEFHERGGDGTLVVTSLGFARVLSFLGYAPSPGSAPVSLRIERNGEGERWVRNFHDEVFASDQRLIRGLISERFGLFELVFKVTTRGDALRYEAVDLQLCLGPLRLTIPPWMRPRMEATERADGPRVAVNVEIGKRFRYSGFITPR